MYFARIEVLILVLLDDGLVLGNCPRKLLERTVLILVLLDDGLVLIALSLANSEISLS